jgi:hypothetical protein
VLPLLLSIALQDDIIGWRCRAERTIDDHVYQLSQAIEGGHRYPRGLRINWLSRPFEVVRYLDWTDIEGWPPTAPRVVGFDIAVAGRSSRLVLRISFADGTGQLLANEPSRWNLYPTGGHRVSFSSMDPGLNRQLWTARNFRAAVEDRRGRVLGTLDIRLPDPAEAVRLAAALAPEVDAKLTDPARPANQCAGYGEEAYVDPA